MWLSSPRGGWLLVGLLGLALFTRLLWWSENPPSLHQDEALKGYNAWSLAHTGCDMQGYCSSALAHGFGQMHTGPLYEYTLAPLVRWLGLKEWVVRLPALLANMLLLGVLWYWVVLLTGRRAVAYLVVGWMVFNPWHFHFSRLGHEASIGPALYLTGSYLLLRGLKRERWLVVLAAVPLALGLYAYQVGRAIVPLLVGLTLAVYWRRAWQRWRWLLLSGLVAAVLVLPLVFELRAADSDIRLREREVLIWQQPRPLQVWWANVRALADPGFLFLHGEADYVPNVVGVGVFQVYLFPLAVLAVSGLVLWWWQERGRRADLLYLVGLLILAWWPTALAVPALHHARAYSLWFVFYVLVAMGLLVLLERLGQTLPARPWRRWALVGVVLVLMALEARHAARFLSAYWWQSPPVVEDAYQPGMRDMVAAVARHQDEANQVYVTSAANQPFIYVLFYLRYPPERFLQDEKVWNLAGFGVMHRFGRYHFVSEGELAVIQGNHVYVSRDLLPGKQLVEVIYNRKRQPVFYVWRGGPA